MVYRTEDWERLFTVSKLHSYPTFLYLDLFTTPTFSSISTNRIYISINTKGTVWTILAKRLPGCIYHFRQFFHYTTLYQVLHYVESHEAFIWCNFIKDRIWLCSGLLRRVVW
jgi:hypothetical protein